MVAACFLFFFFFFSLHPLFISLSLLTSFPFCLFGRDGPVSSFFLTHLYLSAPHPFEICSFSVCLYLCLSHSLSHFLLVSRLCLLFFPVIPFYYQYAFSKYLLSNADHQLTDA